MQREQRRSLVSFSCLKHSTQCGIGSATPNSFDERGSGLSDCSIGDQDLSVQPMVKVSIEVAEYRGYRWWRSEGRNGPIVISR